MADFDTQAVHEYLLTLQDDICDALQLHETGTRFEEDLWERDEGGGGRTRVIADGEVLEKAGVNFSSVRRAAGTQRPHVAGDGSVAGHSSL